MVVGTFHNSAIVLETSPTRRVEFQTWPEDLTDTKSVNWADIPVIGRSEPIKTYMSSNPRVFNFTLGFAASADAGDDGLPRDVKRKVEFCQSLAYPDVLSSGIVVFPPVVLLIVGNLINTRCVMKSVSANYPAPWNMGVRDIAGSGDRVELTGPVSQRFPDLPLVATVKLSLEEVNKTPDNASFVRRGRRL